MLDTISHTLTMVLIVILVGSTSGCGWSNYLLNKKDLSKVTDRLSNVEEHIDRESAKTDSILEYMQTQHQLLEQTEEKSASAFHDLQDQIRISHQQTDKKIDTLQNSMQVEQKPTQLWQKPGQQNISTDKLLIGRLEKVLLNPPGRTFTARIDTGATTSSLDARNIQVFERDRSDWVRFQIQDPKEKATYYDVERPIARKVRIIQATSDEADHRLVVKLQFQIGRVQRMEEFTLEDRSHMDYQVLIGRNVLRDLMVVDVAQEFIAPLPQEKSNGKNDQ